MYEHLRKILARMDELKDKQALFVLSPQEQQELAVLLREYQFKVKKDHPELSESAVVNAPQQAKIQSFQIYLKTGKVISAKGVDPEQAVTNHVPEHLRKEVEFCDPDATMRYTWSEVTRTWVFKSILEKAK
jgi:uncharacterized protein YnzC (UPF0291/DUF896 family)